MSEHLYLIHHGIIGQKWGIRRFQNKDGTLTSAGKERYHANQKMTKNSDGSYTIPVGYRLNRIGAQDLDFSKAGGLYVSDAASDDVYYYMMQLGPTFLGKILNEAHYYVKSIETTKPIKMCSDNECTKMTLDILKSNDAVYDMWRNSIYSWDVPEKDLPSSRHDLKSVKPDSELGEIISRGLSMSFGNVSCSETTAICYEYYKAHGYDAIPDLYDKTGGMGSSTPMIIINKDAVKQVTSDYITKDVMREGKRLIKQHRNKKLSELS